MVFVNILVIICRFILVFSLFDVIASFIAISPNLQQLPLLFADIINNSFDDGREIFCDIRRNFSISPSCHSELVEESPVFSGALRLLRQAQHRLLDFARDDTQFVSQGLIEKLLSDSANFSRYGVPLLPASSNREISMPQAGPPQRKSRMGADGHG